MQETQILQLIASDRLDIPLSSMHQKLQKSNKKSAKNIAEILDSARFIGQRSYAFVQSEDKEKARGYKEAVAEFSQEFPKYGAILMGKVTEKRVKAERHLYFGMSAGSRLTQDDYVGVMQSLGLSEASARSLYPDLMDISRKLSRSRDEERSILVGKYEVDEE